MRLILVRHGQTGHNASDLVQGQTDSSLSERGRVQAELAGRRLAEMLVDALYVSDLERALETASIISAALPEPEPVVDDRLREQHFGVFERRPIVELLKEMAAKKQDFGTFVPKGGETRPQFHARIMSFLEDACERHSDENVVVVTHYGVINILMGAFLEHEAPLATDWRIENGSITIFDLNGDATVDAIELNGTAHLLPEGDAILS